MRNRRSLGVFEGGHTAPPTLHDIGDEILVRSNHDWWAAFVVRKRNRVDGQDEVQYRWKGRKTARPGAWLLATDPAVRVLTSARTYMSNWVGQVGHCGRDQWVVEQLLEERGEGDEKQYLVRWHEWSSSDDTWISHQLTLH